jgi:hypothetical protein
MPAGIVNRRSPSRNRQSRRKNIAVSVPQPTTPIRIVSASATGAVATVGFDQPIALKGIPAWTTDLVGVTAISAVRTNATTIAITFSGALTAATALNIPYEEPAVRNASGGFVSTSTFPV